MSRDLQQPILGPAARYGPYDMEDPSWFVAHCLPREDLPLLADKPILSDALAPSFQMANGKAQMANVKNNLNSAICRLKAPVAGHLSPRERGKTQSPPFLLGKGAEARVEPLCPAENMGHTQVSRGD